MEIIIKNFFFFFLILINFSFILSNEGNCTTIEHCLKCNQTDKCEECESGFELNNDHSKCNSKENSTNNTSLPSNSSQNQNQNNPVISSPKQSFQNNNENHQKFSYNSAQPSSKTLLSAFNITRRLGSDSTKIGIMIMIFIIITMGIILCSRVLCVKKNKKKKKKNFKRTYYYDDINPDERAKVVIIN